MARSVFGTMSALTVCLAIAAGACSPAPVPPSASSSPAPIASSAAPSAEPTASPSPVATPSPSATAAPVVGPGEAWITFQQFPGVARVFVIRPDGTGFHSPTGDVGGGAQTNPDWSPDGSKLVMAVESGGREDLWIVDADGTDARVLVDCEGDCSWLDDPAWAPAGEVVLYSRVRIVDGTFVSTLERVDVASGEVEVIVTAPAAHFYAGQRWSPDGTSVVLEVVELAGPTLDTDLVGVSLAVIDLAAPDPLGRELMAPDRFPETAAWAPDDSVIVFAALEAPGGEAKDLYTIRPDGSDLRRITELGEEGGHATHPDVTPSGSVIFSGSIPGETGDVLGEIDLAGGSIRSAIGAEFIAGAHPRVRPTP